MVNVMVTFWLTSLEKLQITFGILGKHNDDW